MALSGRLDLALAQIDVRKSLVPSRSQRQGALYIEGESDTDDQLVEDEDEDFMSDGEIDIEGDELDIGEVEDVRIEGRLGTESRSGEGEDREGSVDVQIRQLNGKARQSTRMPVVEDAE